MSHIRDLPTEILFLIASYLQGSAKFALARSCKILYHQLRPVILKFNIDYQNSNLLGMAAKDDNITLARWLLDYGANINAFFRGKTPVMRAIKHSSSTVLLLLLNSPGLDINLQNREQESALWIAVRHGASSTLWRVLERVDCAVDLRHQRGQTALHLAVWWGRIGLAQNKVFFLFLESSDMKGTSRLFHKLFNPNANDDLGISPGVRASRINRPSMMALFQRQREYAAPHNSLHNEPSLHQAVLHGSVGAVRLLLLRKDRDLATIDRNGHTALHLAVRGRRLDVVDLILWHPRTDVNCIDNDGNTPLWWSTYLSYDEITERLLAVNGVDVNLVGGCGRWDAPSTSLHHAATRLDTTALKQLLAVPGIDVNVCVERQTPFSTAAAMGRANIMKILLGIRDVEINTGRELMDPPLERLRINQGNLTTHDTALGIAARAGNLDLIRTLLIHRNIDPNLENRWLESPLVLAAKGAHARVVDALLADQRMDAYSLRAALWSANDEDVRRAIQREIDGRRIYSGQIGASRSQGGLAARWPWVANTDHGSR
ncbi:hypothetical protein N7450_011446 [Penicillium hetheringtonii]|uniref:F-box domain-containing protein n=1 Tax=Penicillium hetheringtonii TaxID=911720 RepID=A0AAD6DA16_9EURO|nr:hypothetical protein N7450_011446 [Penicillium hetheringtonii]